MNTQASSVPSATGAPAFWWGRIGLLWLMLTPLAVTAYTLLLPIAPNDFWYNVRAGAFIATTGQIPVTALFTTSIAPDTPYFNQAWISQLLLFKTLEAGGLSAIVLLRTACLTAAFILILLASLRRAQRLTRHQTGSADAATIARVVAGSTLLAFALSASNMDIRPQTFSTPLFALFVLGLLEWPFASRFQRAALGVLLAVCLCFWANLHGAFFVGVALIAALTCGEAVQLLVVRAKPRAAQLFGTVSTTGLLQTLLLLAVAVVAPLLNPRGFELYAYVFKLAALEAGQKFIQEWQAPNFSEWYGVLFFLSLAATLLLAGVLWWQLKQARVQSTATCGPLPNCGLRLGEIFVFVAVTVMALRDIRSIIWFAIFLAPVVTAMVTRMLLLRSSNARQTDTISVPLPAQVVNAILALLLVSSIGFFLPQFRSSLPLPPEYSTQFAPTPRGELPTGFDEDEPRFLLERDTPVEAVAYLRKNPPRGKIWSDMVLGSYLTWAGYPDLLPHADPRVEMFPVEFWEEYGRLLAGPHDAAKALQTGGFTAALLHRKDGRELSRQLQKAGWKIASRHRDVVLLFAP